MEGKIRGFFHAYIGQEAIAAGYMTATRPEDLMITAYRDHGLAIAKGVSVNSCMAELYGKSHWLCKRKRWKYALLRKGSWLLAAATVSLVRRSEPAQDLHGLRKYRGTDNVDCLPDISLATALLPARVCCTRPSTSL